MSEDRLNSLVPFEHRPDLPPVSEYHHANGSTEIPSPSSADVNENNVRSDIQSRSHSNDSTNSHSGNNPVPMDPKEYEHSSNLGQAISHDGTSRNILAFDVSQNDSRSEICIDGSSYNRTALFHFSGVNFDTDIRLHPPAVIQQNRTFLMGHIGDSTSGQQQQYQQRNRETTFSELARRQAIPQQRNGNDDLLRDLGRVRSPEYADRTVRLGTFTGWPSDIARTSANVSEAGFYYTELARFQAIPQQRNGNDDLLRDLGRVRSPEYADLTVRLGTFTRWPSDIAQTPAKVAEAGFYYTGSQDIVRCFVCDGGLKNWDADDDPWIEHARWFPLCAYVRHIKGEEFINLVRMLAEESDEEDDYTVHTGVTWGGTKNSNTCADSGFPEIIRRFACDGGLRKWEPDDDPWIEYARWLPQYEYVRHINDEEFINLARLSIEESEYEDDYTVHTGTTWGGAKNSNTSADSASHEITEPSVLESKDAQFVIEMGFSKKVVAMAINEIFKNGREDFTSQEIIDIILEKDMPGEPSNSMLAVDCPPTVENVSPTEHSMFENKRLKELLQCTECKSRQRNILFLPCTHHVVCELCSRDLHICTYCYRKIKDKVKTYMS